VSGLFHINGYGSFKVSRLFENIELNALNERILAGDAVSTSEICRFLEKVENRSKGRWSLKDPRLSETIGKIYPHISGEIAVIFNFRHPGSTVQSLIKERELHQSHLTSTQMIASAEDEWLRRNRSIVKFLDSNSTVPVLFTDYDELLRGHLDELVCRFVGHTLDLSFIQPNKRHSSPIDVRSELLELYDDLSQRMEVNGEQIVATTASVPVATRRYPSPRTRLFVGANRVTNSLRSRSIQLTDWFSATRGVAGLGSPR
jgi:hypothetical protein